MLEGNLILTAQDWLLLSVRWLHIISAVVWIGGSAFMALVLVPLRSQNLLAKDTFQAIGLRYRQIIYAVITVLLLSGILLAVERIYAAPATIWLVIFSIKLSLSLWMVYIIWRKRYVRKPHEFQARYLRIVSSWLGYNALLVLGIGVLLLSSLMQRVFEVNGGL